MWTNSSTTTVSSEEWNTGYTLTLVLGLPTFIATIAGIIVGLMKCFCEDYYKRLKNSVKCCGRPTAEDQSSTYSSVPRTDDKLTQTASTRQKLMLECDQDTAIKKYLLDRQQNFCHHVNRFTPVTLGTAYQVDIEHMFTDLELLEENMKEGKQVTLQEVLDVIKSTPACRTLIEGEAGIGKSTLLRYLAYNWANDSDKTFEGKIVFLINVRDIGKGKDVLDVIVKQCNLKNFERKTDLPQDPKLITRFIISHDDEIVLLLDGLDELEDGNICPISLFKKEELEDSIVILTSRSENINEFIKESNVHVKVKGFDHKNIIKYIKKHFNCVGTPELGDSLTKELELKRKHPEVYSMCKNPMLLLSVCTIWEDKQGLPANIADLFKEVFRSILNQFNKQERNTPKITKFSDTPIRYVHAMLMLGKCMYKSLKRNQLSINSKDLEGKEEMVKLALKLGFVYIDKPHSKTDFEQCFTAPHKLIVESLVGFYFSKLCQTEGLENTCAKDLLTPLDEDEWEIIRESEHLKMARTFTVKFLDANVGKFFIHWMTKDFSTYRSLMKNYLGSVKAEHQVLVEEALIDHMTKTDLKIKAHVNDICKSLMRYIHHINPSLEVFEDEHFIKLTRKVYNIKLRPSITQPHFKSLCNEISSKEKGEMLAHIMFAIRDETYMLQNIIPEVCADDDIKYLTAECHKLNLNYDIRDCKVSMKSSVTALFLVHLLTSSPKLTSLILRLCITGDIMNDMIRELSNRGIMLGLKHLDINGNNLSTINGASLASFINPNLVNLNLSNCSLTGNIMNDMIRELSSGGIKLGLVSLDINGNNLSTINGASLASLITIIPNLLTLKLSNCSLTGDIMNDMIRELSSGVIKLGLNHLHINGNNLSMINGALLAFLINPNLNELNLSNCSLTCDIMNDMITELSRRGVTSGLLSLYINSSNLSMINGASLACLFTISRKLLTLKLSNCSLTGDIINDMIRDLSSGGMKLGLKHLDIDGNNLSIISGAKLAFFIHENLIDLNLSNCSLTGDIMNDMIRELSSEGIKLGLKNLDISSNNLSMINGASLASLMTITPNLRIKLSDCSLTCDVMNDMIRELSSGDIKLGLKHLDINGNNLSTINGASLASLINSNQHILNLSNCSLTGDITNDMIRVLSIGGIKLGLKHLDIGGNNLSIINGVLLASIIKITPNLRVFKLSNCSLTCSIIDNMIRELLSGGIELRLKHLDIDGNNLSTINGASLASLLTISPNLCILKLSNCSLTCDIMIHMIRELLSGGIKLGLQSLYIDGNNLSTINGVLLASLMTITPKLCILNLSNCSLTCDIMNDMIRELLSVGIKLGLQSLYIDNNNLSTIIGASLTSLLTITPNLRILGLRNCSLTCDINMIREPSSEGIKLGLRSLYVDGNNLSTMNGALLTSLLTVTPNLRVLKLSNCSLTGDITNDMIRVLSSGGMLGLKHLDVNVNNLSTINGASLASLINSNLHILNLSNCSLTGDITNEMIRVLSSGGVKLGLKHLYINGNTLNMLNGASLAYIINPNLIELNLSNCSLTGDIVNDMIRELLSGGIKLGLEHLEINGNNLSTINGSSLAYIINPNLIELNLSNCSLTGDIMNDMIRKLSSGGIKLRLKHLDINGNNLSMIIGASLASFLTITPYLHRLNMRNCSLTCDIINYLIRGLLNGGIKLLLKHLDIDSNNLSSINGASLASLLSITPKLCSFNFSNCNLTANIMNDVIRELSSKGIKLELEHLCFDSNNFSSINGASLASLMSVTPKLCSLSLSNCNLADDIRNDVIRKLSSKGIKVELERRTLSFDGNNLKND